MTLAGEAGGAWTIDTHNQVYPDNFNHGLARFLAEVIQPNDFLEFGGGSGALAQHVARECRVDPSFMIEPEISLTPDPSIRLESLNIDITQHIAPRALDHKFDLVLSIEVAEHVDRAHHERVFDFLAARAGRWVVFSGARPGQGGHGHIAERPETEWREEFVSRGFAFDARLTALARSMSDRKNINHKRNIQVFRAPEDRGGLDRVEQAAAPHLESILGIVRAAGGFLDGNLFYVTLSEAMEGRPAHSLRWKRENLVAVARHATRALEVGFNAGHAALLMLLANPRLHVTCVDRLDHSYARSCFDYVASQFPGRIDLVPGDSVEVLPRLPHASFDLIHLDGGKEKTIVQDLSAARHLVTPDHVLVIDDTHNAALNAAVDASAMRGDLDLFSFAEANARARKSRWHHRLARLVAQEPPEEAAISRLRQIYKGSKHPSIYMAEGPASASPGFARVKALATAIRDVEKAGLDGAFVEVGVAAGHSSVLAAVMASRFLPRDFYLFDTFEGFGALPAELDMSGRSIAEYDLSHYTGVECQSGTVRDRMRDAGVPEERLFLVEGPAEATVSLFAPEQIAILRLNAELYAPTMAALEAMYDRLQPGGWLIVDDYGHWQGCRQATDTFFTRRGEIFRGTGVDYTCFVLRK